MKLRYFILPIIVISLMFFIVDSDNDVINKEVVSLNYDISYPFFSNDDIDNYISGYLNYDSYIDGNVIIDYDIYDNDNLYYLTFYKYFWNDNMVSDGSDSFVIDTSNNSVSRINKTNYEYDVVINRKIDKSKKMIALTFDDGPNYNTSKIIDVLNKYDIKATFFVLGSRAINNKDILKKMADSGMEIGNHTYNHLLLTKYDENKIRSEIEDTTEVIYSATKKRPKLLRPSYGSVNNKIKKVANMPIIIWDIDTLDWKYHNSKRITSRVVNKVRDGDIILMHDIYSASLNALSNIIPILQDNGYEFVTIDELFYYKGISLENGKVYGYAR
ncbi:MAG: polysaccharide deacetylase family protein [Bacilli bacterium]|nr:polysaccharide deacetylase family protein [Bacilli bacterium]